MFQLGTLLTDTIHSRDTPSKSTIFHVSFPRPHPTPPPVLAGLRALHTNNWANARITCDIKEVRRDGMVIDLLLRWNTVQYGSGCSWLVPPSTDSDFQHGYFNTQQDHPWDHYQQKTSRMITFAQPYAEPPQVIVWLCMMDICNNANFHVKTFATDVTFDGFKNTPLQCAAVYWAALGGKDGYLQWNVWDGRYTSLGSAT